MSRPWLLRALAVPALVIAGACGVSNAPPPPDDSGLAARHLKEFEAHDNLVDDPGSPGERQAVEYAKQYLQSLGLQTSIQVVPLMRMIPTATTVQVNGPQGTVITAVSPSDDFVIWAGQQGEQVSLDAEVVFAGYGIVSPEYHRDDYKGLDVTGKVVLVLEGSPRSGTRDELGVLGETYYGTRFYKFAEAAQHGAAGVLIVHADGAVPWTDIRDAATGSIIDIDARSMGSGQDARAHLEGWVSRSAAEKVFRLVNLEYSTLHDQARQLTFRPAVMPGIRVKVDMTSRIERFSSHDVMAFLPGQTSEYVMLAGRWNRIDPSALGRTFSPAEPLDDDGTGAVMVMEAARRIVADGSRPYRGIMFMVATALKPGIVGLEYYLEHPPDALPVQKMNALIFLDRAELSGTSQRVGKIGTGSDVALSQIARHAAVEQGRLIELDENPEKRFYYGFGQTDLVRDGTRMLYLTTRPQEDGTGRLLRHVARRDEVVGLGLGSAAAAPAPVPDPSQDAALLATITLRVANATNWPARRELWRPNR